MNRTIHTLSTSRTALILLLATLLNAATAQTTGAQEAITGLTYNSTGGYYEINDTQDLVDLATYVNGGNNASGKTFKQTADIDMQGVTFTPIGNKEDTYVFYGIYDGDGYVIKNISYSNTESNAISGLFGQVNGTVRNVNLKDCNFTGTKVGGIAGETDGSALIQNCTVLGGTITCTGGFGDGRMGGIVGYHYKGAVDGCFTTASFSGNGLTMGPVVGNNTSNVTNCYYVNTPGGATNSQGTQVTVYDITLGDGITMTGNFRTVGKTVANTYYFGKQGDAVTLGAAPDGWIYAYTVNGEAISGNTFTMGTADVAVAATFAPDPAHFSQSGDTYTINTAGGWNVFCDLIADGESFSGKTVQLDADITVSRMAGSGDNPFCGNFDGGGNTLTFTADAADNYCAPFVGVKGGTTADDATTISNLNVVTTITANDYRHMAGLIALQWGHVNVSGCNATVNISSTVGTSNPHDLYPAALVSQASSSDGGTLTVSGCTTSGTISTDGKYAAGLVGIVQGTATITDCISSVTIDSSTSDDGTHGGIVAALSGVTNIYGTVFNGRLLGEDTESVGGFIGWRNKGANIYNSLFIPTEVTVKKANSATFARNDVDTHNCYYTYYLCDGEHYVPYYATDGITRRNGHATRTVTADADVTIEAVALTGTATQYTVSGITAYSGGGLQRGQTLYYGSGDQLSLTLSNSATGAPQGYQYGYTASAGTLSGSTLTMPDQDVTISAALAPIDWATVNQGKLADPYMIYNKDQLLLLAHRVNGTNGETAVENGYYGKYFKLGADITFTHLDNEPDNYAENYEAIGGYIGGTERYFKGNFDGDGHTVSGIRLRKTGSDLDDYCQGLFGQTGIGAKIHDVHLTDARITGPCYVGGIVGYIGTSTLSGCIVTDSYITASEGYGTICGSSGHTEYLANNYYHGCTVNGTAVTSGMGCKGADVTANNGALPAYRLALGANITTPPGNLRRPDGMARHLP